MQLSLPFLCLCPVLLYPPAIAQELLNDVPTTDLSDIPQEEAPALTPADVPTDFPPAPPHPTLETSPEQQEELKRTMIAFLQENAALPAGVLEAMPWQALVQLDLTNPFSLTVCPRGAHPVSATHCAFLPTEVKKASIYCTGKNTFFDEVLGSCAVVAQARAYAVCPTGFIRSGSNKHGACRDVSTFHGSPRCDPPFVLEGEHCVAEHFSQGALECHAGEKRTGLACEYAKQIPADYSCADPGYTLEKQIHRRVPECVRRRRWYGRWSPARVPECPGEGEETQVTVDYLNLDVERRPLVWCSHVDRQPAIRTCPEGSFSYRSYVESSTSVLPDFDGALGNPDHTCVAVRQAPVSPVCSLPAATPLLYPLLSGESPLQDVSQREIARLLPVEEFEKAVISAEKLESATLLQHSALKRRRLSEIKQHLGAEDWIRLVVVQQRVDIVCVTREEARPYLSCPEGSKMMKDGSCRSTGKRANFIFLCPDHMVLDALTLAGHRRYNEGSVLYPRPKCIGQIPVDSEMECEDGYLLDPKNHVCLKSDLVSAMWSPTPKIIESIFGQSGLLDFQESHRQFELPLVSGLFAYSVFRNATAGSEEAPHSAFVARGITETAAQLTASHHV